MQNWQISGNCTSTSFDLSLSVFILPDYEDDVENFSMFLVTFEEFSSNGQISRLVAAALMDYHKDKFHSWMQLICRLCWPVFALSDFLANGKVNFHPCIHFIFVTWPNFAIYLDNDYGFSSLIEFHRISSHSLAYCDLITQIFFAFQHNFLPRITKIQLRCTHCQ